MTVDPTDPDRLAATEARIDERMAALAQKGLRFQPGLFETVRVTAYLENLLQDAGLLNRAKADYCGRIEAILDTAQADVEKVREQQRKDQLLRGAVDPAAPLTIVKP